MRILLWAVNQRCSVSKYLSFVDLVDFKKFNGGLFLLIWLKAVIKSYLVLDIFLYVKIKPNFLNFLNVLNFYKML